MPTLAPPSGTSPSARRAARRAVSDDLISEEAAANVQRAPISASPVSANGLTVGEPWEPDPAEVDAVGRTMFDVPGSKDNTVTVLLPKDKLTVVPSQSLLRIWSRADDKTYL